ncbi:MAG: hypothetical protein RBR50_09175 [Candidatus Izemoplasmatales bacterium]|nr:hypothetical protein [Candidatus Izemoplasmatales bacterium]
MKKFVSFVFALILTVLFVSCGSLTTTLSVTSTVTTDLTNTTSETTESTTTMEELNIPENVQVSDNIISFNSVDNAEKYRVSIYDASDQLLGEYNITNGFDLSLLLSLGEYSLKIKATAKGYLDSTYSELVNFSIIDPDQTNVLEENEMNNIDYIRWMGRTYYNDLEKATYFYFTASGFEVGFYGTELKVTFKASNYLITGKRPHIVVLLDGEEDPTKGELIVLGKETEEVTIVSGLEYGYHTVKVLKRSEAIDSDTAVTKIETDGYFTDPPKPKSFNLQFIAASSSTGYGNLGSLSDAKTTVNSDGLRAFAYLTSFLLDSEISIFSASGWGVSRGWNTSGGSISETQNIPKAFEYIAIDASNTVFTDGGKWDITNYIPDVIVVNLGTNDFNASGYNSMSDEDKLALEERFKTDYTNFLVLLNNMYPNAKIIVAYGLMNEQKLLEAITLEIISDANQIFDKEVVHAYEMEGAGTLGNPYGSNYHPNVQTSMNVAADLAEFISSITGREVVREMIE